MIRRRYVDGPHGQLHLRESGTGGVPLVCLHATAYSSRSFAALMAAFGPARHVIAVDTPGYGGSDRPASRPTIAGYAAALAPVLGAGPVDLFGYHTGVSLAVELAHRAPGQVRSLVLMGIPHFGALDFAAWRTRLATPHVLGERLDQFAERWDFLVASRPAGLGLSRGFDNFVDELTAWPHGSWAHEALFEHDLTGRLATLDVPALVLNPAGHLAEPSRIAARLLRRATVEELPDLSGAVLDTAPLILALHIERFLAGVG